MYPPSFILFSTFLSVLSFAFFFFFNIFIVFEGQKQKGVGRKYILFNCSVTLCLQQAGMARLKPGNWNSSWLSLLTGIYLTAEPPRTHINTRLELGAEVILWCQQPVQQLSWPNVHPCCLVLL